jgi:L-2,4-diaminobutyrate decarboxylase
MSISPLLEAAFNPETFRRQGHKMVDQLADYLQSCRSHEPGFPAIPWKSPVDMEAFWKTSFSSAGSIDPDFNLSDFTDTVIRDSLHLHHPRNMGHQVVPPVPTAAIVEFLAALLNNSMAIYEVGPTSTAIEKVVTDWLGQQLGMGTQSAGILTSGGSIGNLTGLLAARQHSADYDIWEEGFKDKHHYAVMVPADSHYSIARALKIMGWGEKGIVKIPVNQRRQIDTSTLETSYREATVRGLKIIAVAANACSTSTGSYDPLHEIAEFCEKYKLWMHVDAAHGGGAVLTSKYKHLVKGIECADSVVVDFHKMLLCPALTTAVVFKKGELAHETFSQKAEYLLDKKNKDNWYDIAQRTLECTKEMMGLKIYALLKMYGARLFNDYITRTYDLGKEFAKLIESSADFELALEPAANIVCFRFKPDKIFEDEDLNRINRSIREKLKEIGEYYIVSTLIDGVLYLRTSLMNPFTTVEHLSGLLEFIRKYGQDI